MITQIENKFNILNHFLMLFLLVKLLLVLIKLGGLLK